MFLKVNLDRSTEQEYQTLSNLKARNLFGLKLLGSTSFKTQINASLLTQEEFLNYLHQIKYLLCFLMEQSIYWSSTFSHNYDKKKLSFKFPLQEESFILWNTQTQIKLLISNRIPKFTFLCFFLFEEQLSLEK